MATLPTAFAHYDNVTFIGKGAFGEVYRARDTKLQRDVALKVPHPHLLTDPSFVEGFRKEARIVAHLNHPNIVTIYQIGDIQGSPYIEMRFIEGETLASRLQQKGKLSIKDTVAIVEQICRALMAAHDLGVIHRDLKPGNVLLQQNDQAYVVDFGLAKVTAESLNRSRNSVDRIVGTPGYMAPEQYDFSLGAVSNASDQFSLAMITSEMLLGVLPREGQSIQELANQVGVPLPKQITSALQRALKRQPSERFPSIRDFCEQLTKGTKMNSSNSNLGASKDGIELIITGVAGGLMLLFVLGTKMWPLWLPPEWVDPLDAVVDFVTPFVVFLIIRTWLKPVAARMKDPVSENVGVPSKRNYWIFLWVAPILVALLSFAVVSNMSTRYLTVETASSAYQNAVGPYLLHGLGVPGDTIEVVVDNVVQSVRKVAEDGTWSSTLTFGSSGRYSVVVRAIRADGVPRSERPPMLINVVPVETPVPTLAPTEVPTPTATTTVAPTPDLALSVRSYQDTERAAMVSPSSTTDADLTTVATGQALLHLRNMVETLNEGNEYALLTLEVDAQEPIAFDGNIGYVAQQQQRRIQYYDQGSNEQLGSPEHWTVKMVYRLVLRNGDWVVDAFREEDRRPIIGTEP